MDNKKRTLFESQQTQPPKWRRTYQACLNCRTRKVKCDLGPVDNPHDPPCVRCKRERKECIFTESNKRGGLRIANVSAIAENTANATASMSKAITSVFQGNTSEGSQQPDFKRENSIDPLPINSELTTMQDALEFLAKAAGSVAKEDSRDLVDASTKYEELESQSNSRTDTPISSGSAQDSTRNSSSANIPDEACIAPLLRPHGLGRPTIPLIEKLSSVRPKPSQRLADIEYIGTLKMLSEEEAVKLIDLFFLTMHPFFPHVPLQLQNPDELAQYPILLCAILTISSRYHSFDEVNMYNGESNNRNVEIHERLWIYCQRLISQTVWAEASTRSIGTVLAFLLFTEWNPRAIHWRWSDYANNPDLNDVSKRDLSNVASSYSSSAACNPQQHGDGLTGLSAMRRSDRMAWMLTGSAVRLAQDMGFMNTSSKIFTATHISETHTAMNMNQRSILSQSLAEINLNGYEDDVENESYYLGQILKSDGSKERWSKFLKKLGSSSTRGRMNDIEREFVNDEYVLYYSDKDGAPAHADEFAMNDDKNRKKQIEEEPYNLKFSFGQRAKIELLRIMSIGYETIYRGKLKLYSNSQYHNLALLSILSPLIESWYNTYKTILKPCSGAACNTAMCSEKKYIFELTEKIDRESLISDYYYCQLYIYSLALQVDVGTPKDKKPRMNEITKCARYVELAYNAAKEILNSAIRVHKLKMLKYMPVRWVTRIVRSVAFVVKCYLTLTGSGIATNPEANTILTLSVIPTEEIIQTIQRAAITLREASPDELHLCTRYSTILMYLCTEMKLRSRPNPQPPVPRSISEQPEQISVETTFNFCRKNETHEKGQESQQRGPLPPPRMNSLPETTDFAFNVDNFLSPQGAQTHHLPTQVVDWFSTSDEIGLDFVEPWTEMIEQQFISNDNNKTFENLYNQATGLDFQTSQPDR